MMRLSIWVATLALSPAAWAAGELPSEPGSAARIGANQKEAIRVTDDIYLALGFGNTFLVTTDDGNVVIDTAIARHAPRHKRLLDAVSSAPVRYIVLTHGHGDHTGGVDIWREAGTEVVVQEHFVAFRQYQKRLAGFFTARNAAQFGGRSIASTSDSAVVRRPPAIEPTVLVDDEYSFTLGDLTFEVHATPGETYDALSVWIPERRAAFVGDNFYRSFPNIYTLRGTKPRWALDYVRSLNEVLAWEPEVLLPSHGRPVVGAAAVKDALTQYRDAIRYVHDATVAGMNAGKDVYTLMREIRLPPALDVGQGYGRLTWSIRGIYEGYVGWFDGNPANMYPVPVTALYPSLAELAGPERLLALARDKLTSAPVATLHLTEIVLAGAPAHRDALELRLAALDALYAASGNSIERGWLAAAKADVQRRLESD